MEFIDKSSITSEKTASASEVNSLLPELSELQLAFVGGGTGEIVYG